MIADLQATRDDLLRDLAVMDQRLQSNPFDRHGTNVLMSVRRMTESSIRAIDVELATRDRERSREPLKAL